MILEFLARKLAGGPLAIGQVVCFPDFRLRHVADTGAMLEALEIFADPEDAQHLAVWNDAGEYRPLKSAPDLRRGWELRAGSLPGLRLALDLLYPAALGNALALESGNLSPVDLRSTLARQSGMYVSAKRITDAEAGGAVRATCSNSSRCLKKILWEISPETRSPLTISPEEATREPLPLLCPEACGLLVSAARAAVKSRPG